MASWALRVLWVGLVAAAAPALATALHGASVPVRTVASAGLWVGWAVGVGAVLVRHPVSLTALRMLAPAGAAVVVVSAVAGVGRWSAAVALAVITAAAVIAFLPGIGTLWVNGPAYPNERRFLLRVPGPAVGGRLAVAVTWALAIVGATAGPLLLAAGLWVAGALALVVGLPVAVVAARSLHNLSRRWAVVVPAGLVLHDPVALTDPVLFARQSIVSLGPVQGGNGPALDLTQRAGGPALDLDLSEPAGITLMRPGRRLGEAVEASRLRFTPSRPGQLLDHANERRIGRRQAATPPPSTSSPR
ncbi:MAG: hypothetical protein ACRD0Q_00350 [Acidimicrobiales bacterium]